jgi:hypothetical protein
MKEYWTTSFIINGDYIAKMEKHMHIADAVVGGPHEQRPSQLYNICS